MAEAKKMANRKLVLIGGLTALAIVVAAVVGYAAANQYAYQNNEGQCSGQMMGGSGYGMMNGGRMGGGMMGSSYHMTGYGGMQCPYHQNGYFNYTNMVAIADYGFHPQNVTVKVGTTITWINMDGVAHTVTSDTGLFNSALLNHMQSYAYTFNTAGTYTYHCTPHPYMTGTIVVEA